MPYFPEPVNQTGFSGLTKYANTVTESYLSYGFLLSVYLGVFLWLIGRGYSPSESLTASGFLTVILSVFMLAGGYITNWIMYLSLVGVLIPIAWMYFAESR